MKCWKRYLLKLEDATDFIMGYPDVLKLRSCMKLFWLMTGEQLFKDVVDKFYDGELDEYTRKTVLTTNKRPTEEVGRLFVIIWLYLNADGCYVLHSLHMSHSSTALPLIFCSSFGTNLLDHLAADRAGFPGGQVAVVAIGQVHAHFLCSLHLETVHSLTGLGNVQLVVVRVAHIESLLCFLRKDNAFRRKHFLFRTYSLTKVESCMNGEWRKGWKRLSSFAESYRWEKQTVKHVFLL